jgi:hypothetical protein
MKRIDECMYKSRSQAFLPMINELNIRKIFSKKQSLESSASKTELKFNSYQRSISQPNRLIIKKPNFDIEIALQVTGLQERRKDLIDKQLNKATVKKRLELTLKT